MRMGQDMLVEILSNCLPELSKWWYNLITNPSFVLEHLSNSTQPENNCPDKDEDAMVVVDGKRESRRRRYTYSVWAIQPADVSHRIKKVMEGLRAEFGAFPCKQFYAIFEPPLRGVDRRRRRRLMKSAITSLTF